MDNTTANHNNVLGLRLEAMFHTATAIHNLVSQLISNGESDHCMLWAIKDLAQGQARELEAMSEHFQGLPIGSNGYYANHFGSDDAAEIINGMKQGATS